MTLNTRFILKCALRTVRLTYVSCSFGFDHTHRCSERGRRGSGLEPSPTSMSAADALFLCGSWASCFVHVKYNSKRKSKRFFRYFRLGNWTITKNIKLALQLNKNRTKIKSWTKILSNLEIVCMLQLSCRFAFLADRTATQYDRLLA